MRFFLVLGFLLAFQSGFCQILNLQNSKIEKDSSLVKGNFTASFSLYNRSAAADSPVEFIGYNIKSSVAIFPKNSRISLINSFNYLRINDNDFLNTGFQHVRFSMFEDRKLHPEAFGQYQYDNFRGLAPRILGGVGLRIDLIKKDNFSLFAGPGVMVESESWQVPGSETGEQIDVSFFKSTNYIGLRWDVNDNFDINSINYYQTTYDRDAGVWRNRYNVDLNFNTKISERFGINNSFSLAYEDKPIVDITQTIYSFTAGVNFSF